MENTKEIIQFIDNYSTTNTKLLNDVNLEKLQIHKHKRTCHREIKGNRICRFKMPRPPMKETEILLPINEKKYTKEQKNIMKTNLKKIMDLLNHLYKNSENQIMNYNYTEFLAELKMTHNEYILALRSHLKIETIFMKREVKNININVFNKTILELHQANMDIQFILNPYALCNYLVNYINKSMSGISKILREAIDEIKHGNYSIKQKLLKLSSSFVNGVEISAQEAAYSLLGLHMSQSSVATIFINTFPPNERVKILKSKKKLESMHKDSSNIFAENHLDYYQCRPEEIKNICYAEFVASYEHSDYKTNNKYIKLLSNKGYLHKRKTMKIIRYRKYNKELDPYNYFRENLMLYTSWNNEQEDILTVNVESEYHKNKRQIELNYKKFNSYDTILDEMDAITNLIEDPNDDNTTYEDPDDQYKAFGIQNIKHDLSKDLINLANAPIPIVKKSILPINENEYNELIYKLNTKQSQYLSHTMHQISNNIKFYEFISGKYIYSQASIINIK